MNLLKLFWETQRLGWAKLEVNLSALWEYLPNLISIWNSFTYATTQQTFLIRLEEAFSVFLIFLEEFLERIYLERFNTYV